MAHQGQQRSIIEMVDDLLQTAIAQNASDIHLESSKDALRVRFRIDGILYDQAPIDTESMHQIIARIKVVANIDIAQQRVPQDGKFSITHHNTQIDMRVSTFPTLFGQKAVIRILDPGARNITIDQLGMPQDIQQIFSNMMQSSQGFFLVTGPTGSGKTTTLYAGLSHINSAEKNIITLEDPIEYYIEGITQGHIHPESGFTFEKGMRALLRQDPDVVMVGEIRDTQTAQIAIQAAMTGHLVVSTLHTNDAPSVIMRLMDMGIEPFLINASLSGILAQRLVRLLCTDCKKERSLTAQEAALCAHYNRSLQTTYQAHGCPTCFGLGYKGRIGIFELLPMSNAIKELIHQNPCHHDIQIQAVKDGMRTLMADGLDKVAEGLISIDELTRAIA